MYDLLIRGGRLIDGTGGPSFLADIAVVDDRIVAIGALGDREATSVIDATGRMVCPGFVEEHSHSDVTFLVDPLARSMVRQGVTTLAVGNCGMSAAPVSKDSLEEYRRAAPLFDFDGYDWNWESTAGYLDAVRAAQPSVNVTTLVGHMPVRALATGGASRPATPEERARMRSMVDEALDQGARGFSTGLTYQHTVFADTDEIVESAKALARYGWTYHTHMRGQGAVLLDSVREAIEIAERAGCPLVISHLYPAGREAWGQAQAAIDLVEDARARGIDAGWDVTPWLRGGGPLAQSLPEWLREGGMDATLERLRDPVLAERAGRELEAGNDGNSMKPDWDDWLICRASKPESRSWAGRSIRDIADERGESPVEAVMKMLVEDDLGFWIAPTIKSDEDVDLLIKHPLGIPTADAFALAPEGSLAYQDRPNSYGTFPRVLGRYVRERGILTWEEAVHKMTSIPASRLGLWDRGLLRPGLKADIVVFNPDTVIEKADYERPQEYPVGIDHVIVNGQVTVAPNGAAGDEHTGVRAGEVL
jgi:N-acyl-D-amino-acid deacylase